jgi:hypothetical protein
MKLENLVKTYYDHPFISASNLKQLKLQVHGGNTPSEETFKFGILAHQVLLEPDKVDFEHPDIDKAIEMKETFMKDELCHKLFEFKDFRKEHEFYRFNFFDGLDARCKMDGESRSLGYILEYKGLDASNRKTFLASIPHFDYDMAAAFYLDVSRYKSEIIVGVSKKKTSRLFKEVIDRNHPFYISGREKYLKWCNEYKLLLG